MGQRHDDAETAKGIRAANEAINEQRQDEEPGPDPDAGRANAGYRSVRSGSKGDQRPAEADDA